MLFRSLDMGFAPDVKRIVAQVPARRQTLLFSATMPEEIKKLAVRYMKEPQHLHIQPAQVTAAKVDQKYIAVDPDKKVDAMAHFIEAHKPEQLVVFCKTKHQTDRVAHVLKRHHIHAQAIHGDLTQQKREKTLQDFREGRLGCLIATNVAARGLDASIYARAAENLQVIRVYPGVFPGDLDFLGKNAKVIGAMLSRFRNAAMRRARLDRPAVRARRSAPASPTPQVANLPLPAHLRGGD